MANEKKQHKFDFSKLKTKKDKENHLKKLKGDFEDGGKRVKIKQNEIKTEYAYMQEKYDEYFWLAKEMNEKGELPEGTPLSIIEPEVKESDQ